MWKTGNRKPELSPPDSVSIRAIRGWHSGPPRLRDKIPAPFNAENAKYAEVRRARIGQPRMHCHPVETAVCTLFGAPVSRPEFDSDTTVSPMPATGGAVSYPQFDWAPASAGAAMCVVRFTLEPLSRWSNVSSWRFAYTNPAEKPAEPKPASVKQTTDSSAVLSRSGGA